ncbi:MAG TPA: lactate racemase domain-containing protein, partial [Haliangiales bacterium]|nr:lactate racemase domain-containing protein [Haliangiales bacterium]
MALISKTASPGNTLTREEIADVIAQACPAKEYRDKKVLLIVPDGTRTGPVGRLFQTLYRRMGEAAKAFDVLIALGTHQPMSETGICRRLEIS